ncbi:acyltransferase [Campylobacter devanensis]|uniref:acyltransferase n=1 Tax=Campylobacter devanensis TaxID=3161138 RepID=UPI000A35A0C1|nr:acyltransferase [Campylobacter sp. P0187]
MQKYIRENGNIIYSFKPLNEVLINSSINFKGKNNAVFLSNNAKLNNVIINFAHDDSVAFISSSAINNAVIEIRFNNVFYIGEGCYINPASRKFIVLAEGRNIIIGDRCWLSHPIEFHTLDWHLIYDGQTNQRINHSKSIYIGDHVWIGADTYILKGTQIFSGSIIGARSTVTKQYYSNTINAGNPAKEIKSNVFWDGKCTQGYSKEITQYYSCYSKDNFKYTYNQNEFLSPKAIEEKLDSLNTAQEKLEFVYNAIYCNKNKNRFAYFKDMPYDIPLPKYENKFKSLKFEEIDETKPQPTPPAPKPTPQPTPQELEIKSLKDKLSQKEKDINNLDINHKKALTSQELEIKSLKEALSKKEKDISSLEINYQKALNTKNHLSYKLGQALIKANKNWYKGGYVKFIFEAIKIKKEHNKTKI